MSSTESNAGKASPLLIQYGLVLCAVLQLSIYALLITLVSDLSEWTIIFYRYALMGTSIATYYLFSEGGNMIPKFYMVGWVGILAAVLLAGSGISFTFSILNTHVANCFLIVATTPLWASIFSFLFFGEAVPVRTIVAIVASFTAVAVVIAIEMSSDLDSAWLGNVLAVVSAVLFSLYLVLIRGVNWNKKTEEKIDFVPCLILGALIQAIVSASVGISVDSVSNFDMLYLVIMGVIVLAIGSSLLTMATSHISAPEVALFGLLDSVLEPFWVWLAGYDTPPYYSIYAGIVVVVALTANSILALNEESDVKVEEESSTLLDVSTPLAVGGSRKNE